MANLKFPEKDKKEKVGYYLPQYVVGYIREQAQQSGVSQNDFLTALVMRHAKEQRTKK